MSDEDWMEAAVALGRESRGRTAPNPNVGCVIVSDGRIVGRGATQPGGRPHAEAVALSEAGAHARGATAFVTLEPCAHRSARGPACASSLAEAGIARLVAALQDPDPRTDGRGFAMLREAGVAVECGLGAEAAAGTLAGFFSRVTLGRPYVTLKLAMSIDGRIALASGESRWITGAEARRDTHVERSHADMILVGRGTLEQDSPTLDVRVEGLEPFSPRRAVLTTRPVPDGWCGIAEPRAIFDLHDVNDLLVEGGAAAATAFLRADLVDRLLVYRAPILIGEGLGLGDIGLAALAEAHGRWRPIETAMLGSDRREVYERVR